MTEVGGIWKNFFLHFRRRDEDIEAPANPDKTIPTVVIRPTIRHAEEVSKGNKKKDC